MKTPEELSLELIRGILSNTTKEQFLSEIESLPGKYVGMTVGEFLDDWNVQIINDEDFIHAITVISFDHDIDSYDENENELTGYDCLKYLCDYIQDTNMNIDNLELRFHTANPVGKENMICYWNNFKKQYGENL